MTTARARWCLLLLAALLAAADAAKAARHITIIGASVSDGFGVRLRTTQPDGSRPVIGVNLATLLEAAASEPREITVTTHATSRFFLAPDLIAKESVKKAVADKATLVLAIDWLFWSSYGSRRADGEPIGNCDDRAERLERALAALQPLVDTKAIIVLGDLPDMHSAIDGGMLTEAMVPDATCLARLNARIHAWVAERPNIALLELREVVRRTTAKEPIRACNRDWCEADLGPMLQKDRLHPTLNGTLAVVAAALQAADAKTDGTASKAFELDPKKVRERLAARAVASKGPTDPAEAPPPPPVAADSASPAAP